MRSGYKGKCVSLKFQYESRLFIAYRHVWSAARILCLGYGINQLARDTEITQLNVSTSVQKDIAWLYIAMDDLELLLKIIKCVHGRNRYLSQYGLGYTALLPLENILIELVQRSVH